MKQVTQCYKLPTPRRSRRFRASNSLLLGLAVAAGAMASAGCGGSAATAERRPVPSSALPGWAAVDDPPGVSELAPDLSGLDASSPADTQALVKDGSVIRATTFTFATARDALEARKRGAGDDYQGRLERAFRGTTVGHGPGVGLRLRVPRPTGAGADTAEVYLLAHGRKLTVVELESEAGFDPHLRAEVLRLLSR
jgi:hypothetical protein